MTATAADYLWFEEDFPELANAYCVTLVQGLSPLDVLQRLDGRDEPPRTGADEIDEAAYDLLCADDARQLLAMTTVGDWTLIIEPNGYLGVSEDRALPASAGTRWISHFANINGVDAFLWAEDTTKRLSFEPLFPDSRWGTTPDDVLQPMHDIGFQFTAETSDTADSLAGPAAFALAEHLTGIRLTRELLSATTFVCGSTKVTSMRCGK
ncbi:DUF6461 domain-containing protein [Streptomyces zhihengii]|uniref:Uncharacterized protein n=1 Tax=Streptomyces zhihengii TaxID=1818004 RepID=A0ABS2V1S5_9ACTN|nr:DUF6461 domain-containing protein [Streptomyces zhihengii]MBM9623791.1 hypothetical protein [Streptomyces zhihengii]